DPADPVTTDPSRFFVGIRSERPAPQRYVAALRRDGLKGARLGVLRQAYDTPTLDSQVNDLFRGAIGELGNLGAEVIDPVEIEGLDAMRKTQGACNQFKYDLNRYLAALGDVAPVHSLDEIVESRRFHPSIETRLESARKAGDVPGETPGCKARDAFRA